MVADTHKRLGNGYGNGNGDVYGNGTGYGDVYGYGNGNGTGYGYGNGTGYGTGYGNGNGNGDGTGYGNALLCTGPDLSDVQATVLGVVFESMVAKV